MLTSFVRTRVYNWGTITVKDKITLFIHNMQTILSSDKEIREIQLSAFTS
jgi:hypothetical protein